MPEAEPPAALAGDFDGLAAAVCEELDRVDLTAALDQVWRRVKRLNQYAQEEAPWQLAKEPSEAEHLDVVLYGLAEGLRVACVLLLPFMPESARRVLQALGQDGGSIAEARFGGAAGGARTAELGQLFPKIEPPEADAA